MRVKYIKLRVDMILSSEDKDIVSILASTSLAESLCEGLETKGVHVKVHKLGNRSISLVDKMGNMK